jgi:hypothetical protein
MGKNVWRTTAFCLALLTAALTGCSRNENKTVFTDTDKSEFKVGQVWNYRARPGEESSTLVILKVETAPGWSNIVHVGVTGLKFKTAKGIQDTLPHLPMDETFVKSSVTTKVGDDGKRTDFQEGYKMRREAASSGKGGVFTLSVAEVVSTVEEGLKKAQSR